MNPFDILKNLNVDELKKKSQEALEQLKEIKATGESGGGFVKIVINGDFEILSVDYEENDLLTKDIQTFTDLFISAHNDAVAKIKEKIKTKFSSNIMPGLF